MDTATARATEEIETTFSCLKFFESKVCWPSLLLLIEGSFTHCKFGRLENDTAE